MTEHRGPGRPPHPDVLTPAEWRVLEHIRAGKTNAEIAVRLGISPNTVRYHVSNMLSKLHVRDRAALARWDGRPRRFAALKWLPVLGGSPLLISGGVAVAGIAVVLGALVLPAALEDRSAAESQAQAAVRGVDWAIDFGDTSVIWVPPALATHGDGDIVAAATVGSPHLVRGDSSLDPTRGSDVLVTKVSATGDVRWFVVTGGVGIDLATDIVVDRRGDILVVGMFQESFDLGDLVNPAAAPSSFVLRLDEQGALAAAAAVPGVSISSVAVDPLNRVWLAGTFEGQVELRSHTLASSGARDVFVAVMGPAGEIQWARRFGSHAQDVSPIIATDTNDPASSPVAAVLSWSANWVSDNGGLDPAANMLTSDVVVTALDLAGGTVWSLDYSADEMAPSAVAFDGELAVVGGSIRAASSEGEQVDIFAVAIESGGRQRWFQRFGSDLDEAVSGVTFLHGRAVVSGRFREELFDKALVTASGGAAFVAALAPDTGDVECAQVIENGNGSAATVAAASERVYVGA